MDASRSRTVATRANGTPSRAAACCRPATPKPTMATPNVMRTYFTCLLHGDTRRHARGDGVARIPIHQQKGAGRPHLVVRVDRQRVHRHPRDVAADEPGGRRVPPRRRRVGAFPTFTDGFGTGPGTSRGTNNRRTATK